MGGGTVETFEITHLTILSTIIPVNFLPLAKGCKLDLEGSQNFYDGSWRHTYIGILRIWQYSLAVALLSIMILQPQGI